MDEKITKQQPSNAIETNYIFHYFKQELNDYNIQNMSVNTQLTEEIFNNSSPIKIKINRHERNWIFILILDLCYIPLYGLGYLFVYELLQDEYWATIIFVLPFLAICFHFACMQFITKISYFWSKENSIIPKISSQLLQKDVQEFKTSNLQGFPASAFIQSNQNDEWTPLLVSLRKCTLIIVKYQINLPLQDNQSIKRFETMIGGSLKPGAGKALLIGGKLVSPQILDSKIVWRNSRAYINYNHPRKYVLFGYILCSLLLLDCLIERYVDLKLARQCEITITNKFKEKEEE